jgi:hypothetical protein
MASIRATRVCNSSSGEDRAFKKGDSAGSPPTSPPTTSTPIATSGAPRRGCLRESTPRPPCSEDRRRARRPARGAAPNVSIGRVDHSRSRSGAHARRPPRSRNVASSATVSGSSVSDGSLLGVTAVLGCVSAAVILAPSRRRVVALVARRLHFIERQVPAGRTLQQAGPAHGNARERGALHLGCQRPQVLERSPQELRGVTETKLRDVRVCRLLRNVDYP